LVARNDFFLVSLRIPLCGMKQSKKKARLPRAEPSQ
jgi:hypothetical protein